MKWQYKAALQNAIAALPFFSNEVYYAIQRRVGGLRPDRIDPLDRMKAGADMVEWAASAGFDIKDKTVLEVGTGRMVDLPTAMWLCGAGRIFTVDLNPYLSSELISEGRAFMRRNPEKVRALFPRREDSVFRERLKLLLGTDVADEDLLSAMNIEYMSPADASRLPIADGTIDLHVSHTVLEHIPEEILTEILTEARRVMRPGGLLIHNVDPSDHFAHDDPAITKVNFLSFTDAEWNKWAGNQFMYHNRLRASDYVRIFAKAGVRTIEEKRSIDDNALGALRAGFPVSERFRGFSEEELAITSYSIMGEFN